MTAASTDLDDVLEAYLDALLDRLTSHARDVVADALEAGVTVPELYLDVFAPALTEIGELWVRGGLGVAHEHYATALTADLVGELGPRMRRPPCGGRLAILGTTPGEEHALAARMVSQFLEADGWEVLHLGASTPLEDLLRLIEIEAPDVVALSTSTSVAAPAAVRVVTEVAGIRPAPVLVVGGAFWDTPEGRLTAADAGVDLVEDDPRRLVRNLRRRVPPREDDVPVA